MGWKSKIKATADLVSVRALPQTINYTFLMSPHMVEGTNKLPSASFMRAMIPFERTPPS